MPVILIELNISVIFMDGFSQGPLCICPKVYGESLVFLFFPGGWVGRCGGDLSPLDPLPGALGM